MKKEELFKGEYFYQMPDMLVTLKQGYGFSEASFDFNKSAVNKNQGMALSPGFGFILGEGIEKRKRITGVALRDIAPSIVYSMGLDIPDWVEGEVIEKAYNKTYLEINPARYEKKALELTAEDEAIIAEQLRDLGCLE